MTQFDRGLSAALKDVDSDVYNAIQKEIGRQNDGIELIASENFVSRAVMEAQGSVMTNKYAEGLPARRYYGGCEYVDIVENARDRAGETALWGGPRQRATPLGGAGEPGGLFRCASSPATR